MLVIDQDSARFLGKTYCVQKCKKKWTSRISLFKEDHRHMLKG